MIEFIITIAIALICLYGVVKLHSLYKKHDDLRYIVFLIILLLIFTDTWISFYGQNMSAFFARYRFLFTFIPLAVYGGYSYLDRKRRKEQQEKMKIKSAFKQYVMPSIIEEMLQNPEMLKLGGQKRYITVMFSDIRGFTSLSEKLTPEKLVEVLNIYLTRMTNIIIENKGTVDKYIGDAVMAFWGAPIPEPEQKILAVKTSLEMIEALDDVNKEFKARGFPEIKIGVGINAGDMVVGNMGSDKRFDYTVLGDNVNLASRLESLTKQYGAHTIVSEEVAKDVAKEFKLRDIDLVIVKGKSEPVKIFEVLLNKEAKTEAKIMKVHEKALEQFRAGKFKEAKKGFEECLKLLPDDKTCNLYLQRCDHYIKNPPKTWEGVSEWTTK